jgi:hypothetical protein
MLQNVLARFVAGIWSSIQRYKWFYSDDFVLGVRLPLVSMLSFQGGLKR